MSVAAARRVGIGISGRLMGIEKIEIVEVDPLIGFIPRKRHNDVDEEPDSVAMARLDQRREVGVGSGSRLAVGKTQLPVRREVMGRIVTPGSLEKAICGGQQLEGVDAQFRKVRM